MEWWIWIVIGVVLVGLEVVSPGFVLLFIGLACVITGILVSIGALPSLSAQLICSAVLSLVLLLVARKPLSAHLKVTAKNTGASITTDSVQLQADIEPGQVGKGSTRGTIWSVKNNSDKVLKGGATYKVSKCEGVTLVVDKSE